MDGYGYFDSFRDNVNSFWVMAYRLLFRYRANHRSPGQVSLVWFISLRTVRLPAVFSACFILLFFFLLLLLSLFAAIGYQILDQSRLRG